MYVRISENKIVAVGGNAHKEYLKSLEKPKVKPKAKPKVSKPKATE
mgnify:CR=1 FL=1